MFESRRDAPGFHLHHGNRLEALVEALATQLRAQPAMPLQADTILVPHPGMAQWLRMRLADHLGIAAQLDFPLPAAWFGRLAAAGVAAADNLAWSREALSWRLYGLAGDGLGPLSAAPGGNERQCLARWQLAEQIAGLFERYLLQRPDWLRTWSQGRLANTGVDAEVWQARLWQRLLTDSNPTQRRALTQRLAATPASTAILPQRLFVFGFANLPALFLDGLFGLSERLPVHLYFANPCRHYWGDLLSTREQLHRSRRLAYKHGLDVEAEGHPLLAGYGTVARDFFWQLYAGESAFASESEYFQTTSGSSVLAQWQNQILELDAEPLTWSEHDGSLRLLVAPNRRRELEAVHDLLLGLLDDPTLDLRPHQIAVLAPKLSDYAPLVDAVFGGQPRGRRLPWQLTDLAESERHPLPALFLKLLDLPVWRFGLSDVLDALARPAFAAAFAMAGDELPRLAQLLEQAGARWGLDGAFRARHEAGAEDAYSFRFALDRLLHGWALGEGVAMAGAIAPQAALRGDDAELLGRFVACLATLDHWRERLAGERSLSEWATTLSALRAQCLADSSDDDDNAALLRLIAALDAWRERSASAGATIVPRRLIREALADSLHSTAVSALPGEGVNICAMVPLRGLPFRVVVLLGLGEGEFPRRETEQPDDLCRLRPRAGDRSLPAEDRYLFLEALVCARDVLVLSHVDRDPQTGQQRAPSSLLAEFHDYLRAAVLDGDGEALNRRIEHVALLPSDPRHFSDQGAAAQVHVPSYAGEWLAAAAALPATVALSPLVPGSWQAFCQLFVQPVRTQLRWRGVDLGDREEPVEDSEPFELDHLAAYHARDTVLAALSANPASTGTAMQARLLAEALLPPGPPGARAFADVWQAARRTLTRYESVLAQRELRTVEGRIVVAGAELPVRIADADDSGLLRVSAGKLNGKRRLQVWLDLLALALLRGDTDLQATLVGLDGAVTLNAPADPAAALHTLWAVWHDARAHPLPLYSKTSAAYAEQLATRAGDIGRAQDKARSAWEGNPFQGHPGEGDDPACAELARCFQHWNADPFAKLAIAVYGPVYPPGRP